MSTALIEGSTVTLASSVSPDERILDPFYRRRCVGSPVHAIQATMKTKVVALGRPEFHVPTIDENGGRAKKTDLLAVDGGDTNLHLIHCRNVYTSYKVF
jgi:hypothetical protein